MTQLSYSNCGYSLLIYIIEEIKPTFHIYNIEEM